MSTNKQRGQDALSSLENSINSRERQKKRGPILVAAAAIVVIAAVVGGIFWATQSGQEENLTASEESTTASTTTEGTPQIDAQPLTLARATALPATVTCEYPADGKESNGASVPPTANISTEGTATLTLATNRGDIALELDRSVAPCTVNALTHLAAEGYYNDTVCHRLTDQGIYVLQCGDPTGTGAGGPGFNYANEYPTDEVAPENQDKPVIYPRGTIAMANAGPNTNGSQFFLNYEDSPLAPDYTYVGKINEAGMAVLDSIAAEGTVPMENNPGGTAPAKEVRIQSASVKP